MHFVAFHPVHLAKVIDGPVGQGGAEGQCRVDRDQSIVRSFELGECGERAREGPADCFRSRVAGDRDARQVRGRRVLAVEASGGAAGDVEATLGIDSHALSRRKMRPTLNLAKSARAVPR